MPKPNPVEELLTTVAANQGAAGGHKCWICVRPEVREALRDVLREAAKRRLLVKTRLLNEWIKKHYGFPYQDVGHHLRKHEFALWEPVRA